MIINSIAASLPGRTVSNEETIEMIRSHSSEFSGKLEQTLKVIRRLLTVSGLKERRLCGPNETPIEHLENAVDQVLKESGVSKNDVDLLIYVGVGRGFAEPGNAHLVAAALELKGTECFDVVDACQSYVRALQIADGFFKSGAYKTILVVNAEFMLAEGGYIYPANYSLKSSEEINYNFPSYTLGEAATATLLTPDEPDNFEFHFLSRPDLAELCTIPLKDYEGFCRPTEKTGKNGAMRFTSYGGELHKHALDETVKVFNQLSDKKSFKKVFVHASSKKEWDKFGREIGIQDLIHHVYPFTGNLVSASVPTGVVDALEKNEIKRGDELLFWVGSAGMSFSATRFVFK